MILSPFADGMPGSIVGLAIGPRLEGPAKTAGPRRRSVELTGKRAVHGLMFPWLAAGILGMAGNLSE